MLRFIMAVILLLPALSWAGDQDAIGYVKTVKGGAFVIDGGKSVRAAPGTPIKMGNTLKTNRDGSMGVTFKDNTVIPLDRTPS
jgi:hypothetical protein